MLMFMSNWNEIVIQPVQVEMNTPSRANEQINTWFTSRPLNARTQTRNQYLDSATFVSSSLLVPWITYWYEIPSYTSNTLSWNLLRKTTTSPWIIIIPVTWTYLIQWWLFVSQYLWTSPISIYVDWIISYTNVAISAWYTVPIMVVHNLIRWDEIYIYIENTWPYSIDAILNLSIIKLS